MPQRKRLDNDLLNAALIGLEHQRDEIDSRIAELRSMISGQGGAAKNPAPAGRAGKRMLSSAARRRISEAQRKRWAAFRQNRQQKSGGAKQPVAKAQGRRGGGRAPLKVATAGSPMQ